MELLLQKVNKKYGNTVILRDVTYSFKRGFLYIISGVSGTGKSSLLHIIINIIPPDSGMITFDHQPLAHNKVALSIQNTFLFGSLLAIENVNLVGLYQKRESNEVIANYAKLLKISNILKKKTNVLSGGEKGRLNLLRTLAFVSSVLLVDEPTASVDEENAKLIASALLNVCNDKVVIVTSHQPQFFVSNQTIFLKLSQGNLYEVSAAS